MIKIINLNKRQLSLYKANISIDLKSLTVIASDPWSYVDMYLRQNAKKAQPYWRQANNFYSVYKLLPSCSKALLGYYTILNATKALLISKNINITEYHGLSGKKVGIKSLLSNEIINFKKKGILNDLSIYLDNPNNQEKYTLKNIFYNLPFCNRAFSISYKSMAEELFIPIENPVFQYDNKTKNAQLRFLVKKKNYSKTNLKKIGLDWNEGVISDDFVEIFNTKTFKYDRNLSKFKDYHKEIRKQLFYIHGIRDLWYIKKIGLKSNVINKPSLVLIFAALHKLSEIERYHPDLLIKHLESGDNWIITEFLNNAVAQFVDEISSEITGKNICTPGARG